MLTVEAKNKALDALAEAPVGSGIVLSAYGFDPKADLLAQLLDLNQSVAAKLSAGQPVTAPGLPPIITDPSPYITPDCIRPTKL